MREIKFRQAIFSKGNFSRWHYWGFTSDGTFVGVELGVSTHKEAQERSCQYTGLKDKNDGEIYDGDIIRIPKEELGTYKAQICQIEWDGGCSYQIESDDAGCFALTDIDSTNCEILGNIYENPILLDESEIL